MIDFKTIRNILKKTASTSNVSADFRGYVQLVASGILTSHLKIPVVQGFLGSHPMKTYSKNIENVETTGILK
jgi:hypothetical protein